MVTRRKKSENNWLTTSQAGDMLGVSAMTVCRLCNSGKLKFIRPSGTQRRIHKTVVEAYLAILHGEADAPPTPAAVPTPMPPNAVLRERKRPEIHEWIRQEAKRCGD